MQKKYIYSMLTVILFAVGGLAWTLANNNQPLLGLDLQGGVSVVLQPTEEVSDAQLDQTVAILRERIDQIGVAEPEISAQGQNIVAALPGVVEDQQDALDRLSQTAELRFRPVVADLGNPLASLSPEELEDLLQSSEVELEAEPAAQEPNESEDVDSEEEVSLAPSILPVVFQVEEETATTAVADSEQEGSTSEEGADGSLEETEPENLEDESQSNDDIEVQAQAQLSGLAANCGTEVTPVDEIEADDFIVLPDFGGLVCLGPTLFTGDALESATATLDQLSGSTWIVAPTFKPGEEGIDQFNAAARACFNADPSICPSTGGGRGRLAAVLDHTIISAPTINAESFDRDQIVISGTFNEESARNVAEALNFGALPIELVAQETRTVSAAIGDDVLRAGLFSGIIGLTLVALYLLAYYRLAGLVAIAGLGLSAMILWTVVSWFGETYGLALSLSGVVGLIVAIGVSTDSNIVYFENVKEAFTSGTKAATASERAYQTSISTIIKADVVSLIAAVLLYFVAVGAVRGFAFYLGLATVLDLAISMFFMRPALVAIARTGFVKKNPRLLGMPKPAVVENGATR